MMDLARSGLPLDVVVVFTAQYYYTDRFEAAVN